MRAWRRAHPNATAAHIDAKGAHFEACKTLMHAKNEEALGTMPSRMVATVCRLEQKARAALIAYERNEAMKEVDISEAKPTLADKAVVPVTELTLANELLAACLNQLSLRSLRCVACVNHRW